jgi:glyoxylase-like metal-dependent hydrolase (beta-lactamase superfamily II)
VWQGSYEFIVNQWGVGHGGFHSQSLFFQALDRNPTAPVGKGSMVRVIYDCGSGRTAHPRKALTDAVRRMLSDVADGSTVDLLVISHFDRDHVNGLDHLAAELVKKQVQVARVWAPMLTKIEALFAITTSGLTGAAQQAYAAFVDDPVGRLAELFDGAEVTQITPDDEAIPLSPSGAGTDDADAGGGGDIILTAARGGRGLVASPGATPAGEALWEFQPYVIESTLVGAKAVSASVRKLLGKPVEQCSLADLIRLANNATLLAKFHSAVRQHQVQSKRGTRTSSARTGPNLSSLCVYSGPVSPYDWCRFRRGWGPLDVTRRAIPMAPAWFGTGDAGLLGPQHVDAMRTALTQSRLDRIGISSAPHHGSQHDSGAHLWNALPNARWVTIEANSSTGGTGNRHPHKQVLAELATRNLAVHASTDGIDFCWSDKRIR